jgi:hypothetical protein
VITETLELVIKKEACATCGAKLRPRDRVEPEARRLADVGAPLLLVEFRCASCAPRAAA